MWQLMITADCTKPLYLQGKAARRCRMIPWKALQVFRGTCVSGLDGDITTDHDYHDTFMLDTYYESDNNDDSDTNYSDYDV